MFWDSFNIHLRNGYLETFGWEKLYMYLINILFLNANKTLHHQQPYVLSQKVDPLYTVSWMHIYPSRK